MATAPSGRSLPQPAVQGQPTATEPDIVDQDGPGNVSSAQLDQEEIDDIAAELKKGLKPAQASGESIAPPPDLTVSAQTAPLPLQPAPADEQPLAAAQEGSLKFKKPAPATDMPAAEDTIFIDKDGLLHASGPTAGSGPKE
jgi:hypothetical protein